MENRLHDRMAPVLDLHDALRYERRPHVAAFRGCMRERPQNVDLGDRRRGAQQFVRSFRDPAKQRFKKLLLEAFLTDPCGRDSEFELFELGGDIAFAGG